MSLTFTQKLESASSEQMFWAKIYPKLHIDSQGGSWTLHSGNIYKAQVGTLLIDLTCGLYEGPSSFTFPIPSPTLLDKVDSIGDIVNGNWFYDESTGFLYVDPLNGSDPNDNGYTLESIILSSSHPGHMNLTPGNASTELKYWEGNIVDPPNFKQSLIDQTNGFIPVIGSTLKCLNTDGLFNKFLFDYDFKNAKVFLFQDFKIIGNPVSPVLTIAGVINSFTITDIDISFSVNTFYDVLKDTYPLIQGYLAGLPNIKPDHGKNYLRKIYGRAHAVRPIQCDYFEPTTTSNNRKLVFSTDPVASHPVLNVPINLAGVNTTSTTTVTNSSGFAVGDTIVVEQSGVATYNIFITAVNYVTHLLTHTNIPGRVVASGDDIRRGFISSLKILDNDGSTHFLSYERDWTETDFNGHAGATLVNNFEANHPTLTSPFDPDAMTVTANVYGIKTLPLLSGGGSLGSVSKEGGAVSNPVVVAYDLISTAFRGDESFKLFLDNTSFISETASAAELVGFTIPETLDSAPGTYKDILITVLNSILGRVSVFNKTTGPFFGINRVAPALSTADFTLDKEEILSYAYSQDYEDAPSKISILAQRAETLHGTSPGVVTNGGDFDGTSDTRIFNRNGKYAIRSYFSSNDLTFGTYLWHPNDYTVGATNSAINHILFYLWQRRGLLTITVKNRFIEAEIGNTIQVNRESLIGFDFIFGTSRSRKFILIEKHQGINGVTLVLDDQKGVQDDSSLW